MSKLDEAIALIQGDQGELSNAELAKRVGCDEGIIRRARKEADIIRTSVDLAEAIRVNYGLNRRISELESELAAYRRAGLPPKKDRFRPTFYPLFEAFDGTHVVQTVPCLGDQT